MTPSSWDWSIVEQGREACRQAQGIPSDGVNPHAEGSEPWKMWNWGWNSELDRLP